MPPRSHTLGPHVLRVPWWLGYIPFPAAALLSWMLVDGTVGALYHWAAVPKGASRRNPITWGHAPSSCHRLPPPRRRDNQSECRTAAVSLGPETFRLGQQRERSLRPRPYSRPGMHRKCRGRSSRSACSSAQDRQNQGSRLHRNMHPPSTDQPATRCRFGTPVFRQSAPCLLSRSPLATGEISSLTCNNVFPPLAPSVKRLVPSPTHRTAVDRK